jgi:uncharacterized membrane protein YjjP (DUF1212 family)
MMPSPELQLLASAGRLLLEYNESTGEIHRVLGTTARATTDKKCNVAVSYGGVAISFANEEPLLVPVKELRYNATLQARVHSILARVRSRELNPSTALVELEGVEAVTPKHPRWISVLFLGLAAASLAYLLGADLGCAVVAGIATSLGLLVRQDLGRRHFSLLTLPLAAGFVGAALGGLAIRLGWTHTPELVLIVPSLMIVPGPHLINGLLDLIDNYVPMSIARLGLATSILVVTAVGIFLGVELTLREFPFSEQSAGGDHLNLLLDMFLAGIVTVGFAVFYNVAWEHIGLAAVGGMIGHGLRYLGLEAGWGLVPSTFLGGFAVGIVAAWIARSYKLPFAVVAFAGAVTMMPGLHIYRALSGAMKLARLNEAANQSVVETTLRYGLHATFVVIALAVGLIIASRAVVLLVGTQD